MTSEADPDRRDARLIVDALIREREAQGLSQREVGRRMGCNQSTVSQMEAGQHDPRLSTLQRYARAVNVILELDISLKPEDEEEKP